MNVNVRGLCRLEMSSIGSSEGKNSMGPRSNQNKPVDLHDLCSARLSVVVTKLPLLNVER
jgi:hypothetical protein